MALHTFFFYENESFLHYFWYYLRTIATFLILEVRFFQEARFSTGPGSRSGSGSGSGFSMMPKTMSSFRNFKNNVNRLKWWLFSGSRYTCGITFSNNWIVSYVRKKELSFKICLLNQTWRKLTDTWWKVGTWKFAYKIWRYLIWLSSCFL